MYADSGLVLVRSSFSAAPVAASPATPLAPTWKGRSGRARRLGIAVRRPGALARLELLLFAAILGGVAVMAATLLQLLFTGR